MPLNSCRPFGSQFLFHSQHSSHKCYTSKRNSLLISVPLVRSCSPAGKEWVLSSHPSILLPKMIQSDRAGVNELERWVQVLKVFQVFPFWAILFLSSLPSRTSSLSLSPSMYSYRWVWSCLFDMHYQSLWLFPQSPAHLFGPISISSSYH